MKRLFVLVIVSFFLPIIANAATISFATAPLWVSNARVISGKSVTISTAIMKTGKENVTGGVTFYANKNPIGSSDFSFSDSSQGAVVSVSWVPAAGEYRLSAKITRAIVSRDGNTEELATSTEVQMAELLVVLLDTDGDGIPDIDDPDDDNDGASDIAEKAAGTNPLVKNVSPQSQIAGVSTTSVSDVLVAASDAAQSTGSSLFYASEALRKKGGDYVGDTLARWETATDTATSTAEMGWWWHGLKVYVLKIFSFVLNNVYAFYIVLILLALWLVRKIWRRYSLD